MKKIFFIFILVTSVTVAQKCKNKYNVYYHFPDSFDYLKNKELVLVLDEQFDGNKLNDLIWDTHPPFSEVYPENVCNLPEMLEIKDGKLFVYTDTGQYLCDNYEIDSTGKGVIVKKKTNYKAGFIWSKTNYTYGRFEVRCKIPTSDSEGVPAFWMFGECQQEIDVFEFFGTGVKRRPIRGVLKTNTMPLMSVHLYEACNSKKYCHDSKAWKSDIDFSKDFHTFAVEWNEFGITWFIDSIERRYLPFFKYNNGDDVKISKGNLKGGIYKRLNNIINLAQSVIVMNPPTSSHINAKAPISRQTFEIDYIKVWTYKTKNDTIDLCNVNYEYAGNNRVIVADVVKIGGQDCINSFPWYRVLHVYAKEIIVDEKFDKTLLGKIKFFQLQPNGIYKLKSLKK